MKTHLANTVIVCLLFYAQLFGQDTITPQLKLFKTNGNNEKFGYINLKSGDTVILPIYTYITEFSEGLAAAYFGGSVSYDMGSHFSDGKWGYIDTKGETILPFIYESATTFKNGIAQVEIQYPDRIYIDKTGRKIIDANVLHPTFGFHDSPIGLAIYVSSNENCTRCNNVKKRCDERFGCWGIVTFKGEKIINAKYEHIDFSLNDSIIIVKQNDKWGFYDFKGNQIVKPSFSYLSDFDSGYAVFRDDNVFKYGVINSKGEIVIEPKYHSLSEFNFGKASFEIYKEGSYKLQRITQTYQVISNKGQHEIEKELLFYSTHDPDAIFEKGTLFIDSQGKLVERIETSTDN